MSDLQNLERDEHGIIAFEKALAEKHNEPVARIVVFTPALAGHILAEHNGRNRNSRPSAVKRYRGDMENGEWKLNGETLKFTDRGRLGDGQNRLMACRRAGVAFTSLAVFGVEDELFYSMDQGKNRDPADILHLAGIPNARDIAKAVRWAELVETNSVRRRHSFTPPEILKLFQTKHEGVEDFIDEARKIGRRTRQPVGMVAGLLYVFTKHNPQMAADFSDAWFAGTFDPPFRPIGTLQAEMLTLSNKASGRIHEVVRAAMIIRAWNACQQGLSGRSDKIKWAIGDLFPLVV